MHGFRKSFIEWSMDRILFFTVAKGRKEIPGHKVQIFRSQMEPFVVYYFQLCGYPQSQEYPAVLGEMQKAYSHMQERFTKREEALHTYLTFDEGFEKWLVDGESMEEWLDAWGHPLYYDFANGENLRWMLEKAVPKVWPGKAYILGSGIGIRDWIPLIADKVNTIEFYLEFTTKGVEELQEMLLEEYGMLTRVHLTTGREYAKLHLRSEEPVLVIDFSGREPMSVFGLKRGSVWMDMDASEAKRHAMEDRHTGVQYYSLKTIWKREMLQTLDIISKFAYNTDVKIGRL